ncbi:hypothetical protein BDV96DRAFT_613970 [Lophiotrema nucula]|uniref:Uncharacterized protein n=1 Tax=Lophiotrema nucula TaxID=690887 RepID=A0A6A5Z0W0_9PLEO|nr:hypothetical protein BDV96DRAFT_613970 [Lophiotrema nucula]
MSTRSQSPGPKPAASSTTKRTARKVAKDTEQPIPARAGSAGGILLSKGQGTQNPTKNMSSSPAPKSKAATSSLPPAKDAATPAATSTGPNRQRRRPRKLNRDAPETTAIPANVTEANTTPAPAPAPAPAATTELEALKSRVRGLEAKVEELYQTGTTRSGKSPRRRGKGRKNSSQSVTTTAAEPTPKVQEIDEEDEEEADEELTRLEGELEVARRDLATFGRPRPRTRRTTSGDPEFIEEIPRDGVGVEESADTGDRQVTLTGSYRIPLPSTVSMTDVKNLQSGVSAAQNVARSFLEQRRAQQSLNQQNKPSPTPKASTPKPSAPKAKAKAKAKAPSMEVATQDEEKQSWGEWFGGYSMAISRAVKNIEAEAAIQSQQGGGGPARRPAGAARTASAPATKTAKPAAKASQSAAKTAPRPGMKPRGTNLSNEQVQGLLG